MNRTRTHFRAPWPILTGFLAAVILSLWISQTAIAQERRNRETAIRERSKGSQAVLRAFQSVAKACQDSVVEFDIDERAAALGTVIDESGLIISKASEVADGTLTCRLASGRTAPAEIIAIDQENDLALIKVHTNGLHPVVWSAQPVNLGQWAVTPGLETVPEAVGIVSAAPRKILPKQAYIGVRLDFEAANARIAAITPGLGAEKSGLLAGDVILRVNDLAVTNSMALVNRLRTYREGQLVTLKVRRADKEWDATIPMSAMNVENRWRSFNRQERMNHLGTQLSKRSAGFPIAIQHDTVLQPWQCGGPLLNVDGEAIGLNIARAGRVASYALPVALVKEAIASLKKEMQLPVSQPLPGGS